MVTQLSYAIKYVGDMSTAVRFYQERLGLKLRFQSRGWSEFETGSTTLALHAASPDHPAGSCGLGFRVGDIDAFYAQNSPDVKFTSPPMDVHGQRIARFRDADGAECSVGGT